MPKHGVPVQAINTNPRENTTCAPANGSARAPTPIAVTQPCNACGEVGRRSCADRQTARGRPPPATPRLRHGTAAASAGRGSTPEGQGRARPASRWAAPGVLLPNGKSARRGARRPPCNCHGTPRSSIRPCDEQGPGSRQPPGAGPAVPCSSSRFPAAATRNRACIAQYSPTISRYFHDGTRSGPGMPTISMPRLTSCPGKPPRYRAISSTGPVPRVCSNGDDGGRWRRTIPWSDREHRNETRCATIDTAHHSTMGGRNRHPPR